MHRKLRPTQERAVGFSRVCFKGDSKHMRTGGHLRDEPRLGGIDAHRVLEKVGFKSGRRKRAGGQCRQEQTGEETNGIIHGEASSGVDRFHLSGERRRSERDFFQNISPAVSQNFRGSNNSTRA